MDTFATIILSLFGITIGTFWLGFLYCTFIMNYMKGSKHYYWIKKHLMTDKDLEPLD